MKFLLFPHPRFENFVDIRLVAANFCWQSLQQYPKQRKEGKKGRKELCSGKSYMEQHSEENALFFTKDNGDHENFSERWGCFSSSLYLKFTKKVAWEPKITYLLGRLSEGEKNGSTLKDSTNESKSQKQWWEKKKEKQRGRRKEVRKRSRYNCNGK